MNNEVPGSSPACHSLDCLQVVQNAAGKLLTLVLKVSCDTDVFFFIAFQRLSIKHRIQFKVLVITACQDTCLHQRSFAILCLVQPGCAGSSLRLKFFFLKFKETVLLKLWVLRFGPLTLLTSDLWTPLNEKT